MLCRTPRIEMTLVSLSAAHVLILSLVTGTAMKSRGPGVGGSAAHVHVVTVRIISLARESLPRVAVHATRMLEYRRDLQK
jgi:hypothetical protein